MVVLLLRSRVKFTWGPIFDVFFMRHVKLNEDEEDFYVKVTEFVWFFLLGRRNEWIYLTSKGKKSVRILSKRVGARMRRGASGGLSSINLGVFLGGY